MTTAISPVSPQEDDLVVIAKVGASYGLKGFCKLNEFAKNTAELLKQQVFAKRRGRWQPCDAFELLHHADRIMIRFLSCETPEATVPYVNLQLAVLKQTLPACDEGEFYWAELEGMDVINHNEFPMGKVQYVFESGASDILVIKGEKEHLIPFVDDFILSIDRDKKLITVNWDPNF